MIFATVPNAHALRVNRRTMYIPYIAHDTLYVLFIRKVMLSLARAKSRSLELKSLCIEILIRLLARGYDAITRAYNV